MGIRIFAVRARPLMIFWIFIRWPLMKRVTNNRQMMLQMIAHCGLYMYVSRMTSTVKGINRGIVALKDPHREGSCDLGRPLQTVDSRLDVHDDVHADEVGERPGMPQPDRQPSS